MHDAPLMLGISGLRGIVGKSLTPELALNYAAAFAATLNDTIDHPTIAIGRDGRAAGEMIHHAAIAGLLSAGADVIDLDVACTPTVAVACARPDVDAALIITASHNPAEWNGIKCLVLSEHDHAPTGLAAHAPPPDLARAIIHRFENPVPSATPGSLYADNDAPQEHVALVLSEAARLFDEPPAFRSVLDAVNASGSRSAIPLLRQLGHPIPLFCDDSGIFPHNPEPTAENLSAKGGLCDAVPGLNADVGFAQDPDADRLAIIDELGTYIGEEYTLVLAAEAILRSTDHAPDNPPVICVNLSTSRMIDDVAERHGARVVRTPVGEAHVVAMMQSLRRQGFNVILGGEGNGGVIWPRVTLVRDSLSAIALTLALMARTRKPLSRIVADMPRYAIVKRKQPLARKQDALPALERLANTLAHEPGSTLDTQDGVRVDWPEHRAWVHVRPSNTEPILRLIAEAPTQDAARAVLDKASALLSS